MIPHDLIELEITEGTLIDIYNEKLKVLDKLIVEGFKIAIDDFATGYSSLSYLINIPVNKIKIDKLFIDNIKNYKSKALVKSIVDLSQTFKYKLITKEVETKEQMEEVTNLGCNTMLLLQQTSF